MGLKLYEETSVQAIANAIRAKNGSSDTYNISEMSTAIANIPSGGDIYKYHWSNDGKICVREGLGEYVWFFVGYIKETIYDVEPPEELVDYFPAYCGRDDGRSIIYGQAYATASSTTSDRHIGFYNKKIRTWNSDLSELMSGTFYGVIYITPDTDVTSNPQMNNYTSPTDVPISDITLIEKTITENGVYSAEDDGYTGYSEVTVNVPTVEGVIIGRTGDDRIVLPYTDLNDDYEYVLKFYNSSYQHNVSILGNSANGYNIQLTEYSNAWYCDGGNNDQLSYTPASTDDFVGHFIFVSNAIDGTMGLSDRDIALFDEGGILLHKFGTKGTSVPATPDIWLLSRSGTGEATNGVIERFTVKDKSNNNAIVCDYIPAMVAVDGIKYSGLLNTVNNTFIYNSYRSIISGVAF